MSRGQLARTPANFPRMKDRGRKRRLRPLIYIGAFIDEGIQFRPLPRRCFTNVTIRPAPSDRLFVSPVL